MNPSWTDEATTASTRYTRSGPAEIVAVLSRQRVKLTFGDSEPREASLGRPDYAPSVGDRVLAFGDSQGSLWIVGLLAPSMTASLLEDAEREAAPTRVRDKRGRLLFEYDPETDRAVLHQTDGDLELRVEAGALRVHTRDGVEVDTDAAFRVRAGRELDLTARKDDGPASRLRMQPGELSIASAVVTAAATQLEVLAERASVQAQRVQTHVERARHVAKTVELRAGRIVEHAVDVYREAEGLSQTRAGRLKLVAKRAAQLVGENTLIKARDRMKVKGERIHLA